MTQPRARNTVLQIKISYSCGGGITYRDRAMNGSISTFVLTGGLVNAALVRRVLR